MYLKPMYIGFRSFVLYKSWIAYSPLSCQVLSSEEQFRYFVFGQFSFPNFSLILTPSIRANS
jgi:hypothetical protein